MLLSVMLNMARNNMQSATIGFPGVAGFHFSLLFGKRLYVSGGHHAATGSYSARAARIGF
ncbi:MAG: hypothetical protein WB676_00310 [Bryobacteraceae bacterium]